ncbi:hypothetical protein BJ322DRAFT_1175243, partial [Thelephora terrestris]
RPAFTAERLLASKTPAKTTSDTEAKNATKTSTDTDGRSKTKIGKETYIYKVPEQIHPDTGISNVDSLLLTNKAMVILNSFVNDIFERITTEASNTGISNK